jgi:hypothetical protein
MMLPRRMATTRLKIISLELVSMSMGKPSLLPLYRLWDAGQLPMTEVTGIQALRYEIFFGDLSE